ncbi:hypothetical protein [Burkholderia cenocepacia]|jgi:hypothetical protein|uniref:Hypothetical phage protein n=1 Tax=Burkholderia cenocepacia (strain ATCC BAA-245 / DSM 16553 / LMG 16656 / NCTC 13227 / J2315 / CF5610) TaxID=216591 RepID=B4EFQ2_BURCJ|nr:hypothetical protein [Burkholderia cenocepacia]KIS52345.1 hypothetical protein NP88_2268 [Burkholderia cepacia]EPZ89578.1 hypothetical protein BURCENK562V_C3079 [Burkholderia cenocepacia K56-2Valvano]ERI31474.1 hypothetical protein BURCENBC7_AP3249 [Burkholderia cenocepacia BC7]QKT91419.1 hypothetical protein FOC42_06740 [Burkholderia cenocepacia]QNN06836.1 hypothetical protein K562_21064 [Burkholderia cenocepacia]
MKVTEFTEAAVRDRLGELEGSLGEHLDDEARADILDEIAECEDWLEENAAA